MNQVCQTLLLEQMQHAVDRRTNDDDLIARCAVQCYKTILQQSREVLI